MVIPSALDTIQIPQLTITTYLSSYFLLALSGSKESIQRLSLIFLGQVEGMFVDLTRPCDACGKVPTKEQPNQACHIRSRGAFGDDAEDNLLSMCAICHHNQHLFGWKRFLNENQFLRQKLAQKGWRIGENFWSS